MDTAEAELSTYGPNSRRFVCVAWDGAFDAHAIYSRFMWELCSFLALLCFVWLPETD